MPDNWYIGGDYDNWLTTEPEPRDVYEEVCAAEEARLDGWE